MNIATHITTHLPGATVSLRTAKEWPYEVTALPGSQFCNWTVIALTSRGEYRLCRCVCGKEREVFAADLKRGKAKSCGCYRRNVADLNNLPQMRPVMGYEGRFSVCADGRIFSHKRHVWISTQWSGRKNDPYEMAVLFDGKRLKRQSVHRIVAKAWIPNPLNLAEVNHINEIKMDNRASNLEWCSRLYNARYSAERRRNRKAA